MGFVEQVEELGMRAFTINDASRILGKNKEYTRLVMHRLLRRGLIRRLGNGRYYTKHATIYEIASGIVYPCYVSAMAAANYYNLTTQIPIEADVVILKRHKAAEALGTRIRFITTSRKRFFGFHKEQQGIFMADIEKALVDMVYFRIAENEADEIFKNAYRLKQIDVHKLSKYANTMASKKVNRIVGKWIAGG